MNERLKAFLKKQVTTKLISVPKKVPEKKGAKKPEQAPEKGSEQKLAAAVLAVGAAAFLTVCAVKSLQALRQALQEKEARQQAALPEEAPGKAPAEPEAAGNEAESCE